MPVLPLPVIIDPFTRAGDEIAGETADEIAHNLAAGTRIALAWRGRLRRPCPDLRAAFRGHALSEQSERDLREVDETYRRLSLRDHQPPPPPPPSDAWDGTPLADRLMQPTLL